MKHKLILYILGVCIYTCITFSSYAQHLSIKGIEINGHPTTFVSKLKQKGFTSIPEMTGDGQSVLQGTFFGYRDSYIVVEHGNGNVSEAMVLLQADSQWVNSKEMYNNLKSAYKEKYKIEPECKEYFKNPEDEPNGLAHSALNKKEARFECMFNLDYGKIILKIIHVNVFEGNQLWSGIGLGGSFAIRIYYIDKSNYELQKKANLEDL